MKTPFFSESRRDEVERLMASITSHRRLVSGLKKLMVALALGLIAVVVGVPLLNSGDDRFRIAFSEIRQGEASAPVMVNPRLQAVDENGRPYNVSAEAAQQVDEHTVSLSMVEADFTAEDNTWLFLSANEGNLNLLDNIMVLNGDVHLFVDSGYEIVTETARINMDEGTVIGQAPVAGQGPPGTLEAGAYEVTERGDRLLFTNNVRLTLYPGAAEQKE